MHNPPTEFVRAMTWYAIGSFAGYVAAMVNLNTAGITDYSTILAGQFIGGIAGFCAGLYIHHCIED